jgi:hypothetical protein
MPLFAWCELRSIGFLHFVSQLCTASKLVCSLLEAMAGSLSVAVSSAKVVDVVSGEIGSSAVNSR